MNNQFCTNCGAQLMPDSKFCIQCGEKMTPDTASMQTNNQQPPQQAAPQQTPQPQQAAPRYQPQPQPQQAAPQYQQPQAAPQYQQPVTAQYVPPLKSASTAKANGLIFSIFSLIVAALIFLGSGMLSDKKSDTDAAVNADIPANTQQSDTSKGSSDNSTPKVKYGDIPSEIAASINKAAAKDGYLGEYTGKVYFTSLNLESIKDMLGGEDYVDVLIGYNGKSLDCTATYNENGITVYNSSFPFAQSDGSIYKIDPIEYEQGKYYDEEVDNDDETGSLFISISEVDLLEAESKKGIYILSSAQVTLPDGSNAVSEVRIKLQEKQ